MLTLGALQAKEDIAKKAAVNAAPTNNTSTAQTLQQGALRIYKGELSCPPSLDLGLKGVTRSTLRAYCEQSILEASKTIKRKYSYSQKSSVDLKALGNDHIQALKLLQQERMIATRLGFPDKAFELDKEIELMREKALRQKKKQEREILENRMRLLKVSHARKQERLEVVLAQEMRDAEEKFKEEEDDLLKNQEREFLRMLGDTTRRALGQVKKCVCNDYYLCTHNKVATYNTRKPLKVVVEYRRNAKRLKSAGRAEEATIWEDKAKEIDDIEQDKWCKHISKAIVSSPWGANEALVDQMTEMHKKDYNRLKHSHDVKRDEIKYQHETRRRNFVNMVLAEERKVRMQCRKQAKLASTSNLAAMVEEEHRKEKLYSKSEGLKNVSKNLLGLTFDDADRAQVDWVPPTTHGLDNSISLKKAAEEVVAQTGVEGTRILTTIKDIKQLSKEEAKKRRLRKELGDEYESSEDEEEEDHEYKFGETSGSKLMDRIQRSIAQGGAAAVSSLANTTGSVPSAFTNSFTAPASSSSAFGNNAFGGSSAFGGSNAFGTGTDGMSSTGGGFPFASTSPFGAGPGMGFGSTTSLGMSSVTGGVFGSGSAAAGGMGFGGGSTVSLGLASIGSGAVSPFGAFSTNTSGLWGGATTASSAAGIGSSAGTGTGTGLGASGGSFTSSGNPFASVPEPAPALGSTSGAASISSLVSPYATNQPQTQEQPWMKPASDNPFTSSNASLHTATTVLPGGSASNSEYAPPSSGMLTPTMPSSPVPSKPSYRAGRNVLTGSVEDLHTGIDKLNLGPDLGTGGGAGGGSNDFGGSSTGPQSQLAAMPPSPTVRDIFSSGDGGFGVGNGGYSNIGTSDRSLNEGNDEEKAHGDDDEENYGDDHDEGTRSGPETSGLDSSGYESSFDQSQLTTQADAVASAVASGGVRHVGGSGSASGDDEDNATMISYTRTMIAPQDNPLASSMPAGSAQFSPMSQPTEIPQLSLEHRVEAALNTIPKASDSANNLANLVMSNQEMSFNPPAPTFMSPPPPMSMNMSMNMNMNMSMPQSSMGMGTGGGMGMGTGGGMGNASTPMTNGGNTSDINFELTDTEGEGGEEEDEEEEEEDEDAE